MPRKNYDEHKEYMRERYHSFSPTQRAAKKVRDDARRTERLAFLR